MSNGTDSILERALAKLRQQEAEVVKTKNFINQLLEFDGKEPMFSAEEVAGNSAAVTPMATLSIKPGQFLGKPLATAVKTILEMKKEAMETDDLHAALIRGNFDFGTSDIDNQKRNLRISLGKNIVAFRRLPHSDKWGMAEWYPGSRSARSALRRSASELVEEAGQQSAEGGEAAGEAAAPETVNQVEGK